MIYTAEPGTPDAERLALVTVLGTQGPAAARYPAGPAAVSPAGK